MATNLLKLKTQKIPTLRFPGFLGEWEEKRLKDVASIERGRFSPRPRNNPKYYGGKIPFVQTGDVVKSGGIIKDYTQTLNDEGLKVSKLFTKGSILITIAANIGYTGILDIDMACPDSLIGIKCKDDTDNVFLNYYLSTQQVRMDRIASQAAQKNINIEFLKPYKIFWTSLAEQQKIAGFLSVTDEWIGNLRTQKKFLEKYRKGMMQKIFAQEFRFKNDDGNDFGEWEEKDFLSVFKSISTKSHQIKNSEILQNGDYKVVDQSMDLVAGYSNKKDMIFDNIPVIVFGDHTTILKYVDFNFIVGADGTKILNTNTKENNLKFLYYLLQSDPVSTEGYKRHYSILKSRNLFAPHLDEQQKIAEFLTAIDNLIESKQQQITQAELWKKGLMQGLFV